MNGIYILLGSNMGDRHLHLSQAKELIINADIILSRESEIYETEPWGVFEQATFLNQVIEIQTHLTPHDLLEKLLELEDEIGRVRSQKWGERIIDIDLLFYKDEKFSSQKLILPHPEIANRRFTLIPLSELCPMEDHPVSHKTMVELLQSCTDNQKVWKYGKNPLAE